MVGGALNRDEYEDMKVLWDHAGGHGEGIEADVHFYDGLHKIKAAILVRRRKRKNKRSVMAVAGILGTASILMFFLGRYQGQSRNSPGVHRFESSSVAEIVSTLE